MGSLFFLVMNNPVRVLKRDLNRNTLMHCNFEVKERYESSSGDEVVALLYSPHPQEVVHLFIV